MNFPFRYSIFYLFISLVFVACTAVDVPSSNTSPFSLETDNAPFACPVTEPAWVLAPEDSAVLNPPAYGFYYVNEDSSIWASAYWPKEEEHLRAGEEGNKMGWFRPAGALLEVTGRRLDGEAPAFEGEFPSLKGEFPCCYPTRFQASGIYFPTEGCWEVTARAADSTLTFVVEVKP